MHRKPPLPGKRSRIIALFVSSVVAVIVPCAGQALYSFGDPTADEQLYLELINRARANPPAEGARLAATTDPNVLASYTGYAVDLALMQAEFNLIAATPPLVPHAALMTSARSHSAWMLANATQAHNEPTNTPFTRMTAAGYIWSTAGENIYAFSKSTWYDMRAYKLTGAPAAPEECN
ncbi:MAG: hypothetical protein ABI600_16660 [Luteolibacter sp.]